jgi:hypothetical protein
MDAALVDLLEARAPALAAGLEAAILAHDAPHYHEAPPGVLRARCERLVGAFLEAQVWPLVAGLGGQTDDVVRRLALVTGAAGRGKDELARAFLEHKERAEARAARLQHRLDALFAGTEPPPEG